MKTPGAFKPRKQAEAAGVYRAQVALIAAPRFKANPSRVVVNHSNFSDRRPCCQRRVIQISALSALDGRIWVGDF